MPIVYEESRNVNLNEMLKITNPLFEFKLKARLGGELYTKWLNLKMNVLFYFDSGSYRCSTLLREIAIDTRDIILKVMNQEPLFKINRSRHLKAVYNDLFDQNINKNALSAWKSLPVLTNNQIELSSQQMDWYVYNFMYLVLYTLNDKYPSLYKGFLPMYKIYQQFSEDNSLLK